MVTSPATPNGNSIGPTVYLTVLIQSGGSPELQAASNAKHPNRTPSPSPQIKQVARCCQAVQGMSGAKIFSIAQRAEVKMNTGPGLDLVR